MQPETLAFSRQEAADALCISLRTLDHLLAQGKLRGKRIGRRVLIPKGEINKLLQDTPVSEHA